MNPPFFRHRLQHPMPVALGIALLFIGIGLFSPPALAASPAADLPETASTWSNSTQITTAQGTIDGFQRNITTLDGQSVSVYAWLGIPYVKNPITAAEKVAMRWAAPHLSSPGRAAGRLRPGADHDRGHSARIEVLHRAF